MLSFSYFPAMSENFIEVCSLEANNRHNVSLFRSKISGMRVAFIDFETSLVNGLFLFDTKTTTDDGLPHTLEHLVFLGSQKYPFKGFLDSVSSRCFASYINAYTEEDHTGFKFSTIGSEGFFKILPIYLNHLMHPLLTPEHYATEIHHINGEGRNGGVVYAEMQGRENKMNELMHFARRRLAFPEGHPLRSNTGGTLEALRNLCSLERVKEYHKKYYNFSNMVLIVDGSIDKNKVFNILGNFETDDYENSDFFKKSLNEFVVLPERYDFKLLHLQCPMEGETTGMVSISWQGPLFTDPDYLAILPLLKYFCNYPDSPLNQNYIQIDDPICSHVIASIMERSRVEITLDFGGVKDKFLDNEKMFTSDVLNIFRNATIDMDRMKAMLQQQIHSIDILFEGNPSKYYQNVFISYFLNVPGISFDSDNIPFLQKQLNIVEYFKTLLQKDEFYWKNLITKYFTADQIIVIGHPNAKLANELAETEEKRVKAQIEKLGLDGLVKCGETLQKAVAKNEASAPTKEILQNFIVNNFDVKFINVERKLNQGSPQNPYPTIHHKTDSKFLRVTILFDIHEIPAYLRPFIQIYMKLLKESNFEINGEIVNYANILTMLKTDFILYGIGLNSYQEFLVIYFDLLPENYPLVNSWVDRFLKNVIFENSRISSVAKRLLGNTIELKKDGNSISTELIDSMIATKTKIELLRSEKLHTQIAEYASSEKAGNKIINILNELAQQISKCPRNIHFIGNSDSLKNVAAFGWNSSDSKAEKNIEFLIGNSEYSEDLFTNMGKSFCIPHGTSESSFLIQALGYKFDFMDSKFVYARLLSEYLSQTEGPLHNQIRGKGLAYGVYLYVTGNTGLRFSIYRATNLIKAYEESKRVVLETIISENINAELFEAAKRKLISEWIEAVSDVRKAGHYSFVEHLHGIQPNQRMIKFHFDKIWEATPKQMLDSVSNCFMDLFNDEKCIRAIVPYKNDLEKVERFFTNIEIKNIDNLYFEDDSFIL